MVRILWVSLETPAQDGQGGQRRQYHQIKALLARGHDITVLVPTAGQDDSSIRRIVPVLRPRVSMLGRLVEPLVDLLRRRVGSSRWDAVVISHHESIWLAPERTSGRMLVDVHNVMSHWYATTGRDAEAREAHEREHDAIRRADAIMTCSETEVRRLVGMHPDAADRAFAAPVGVDPTEWPDRGFPRDAPRVALFGTWSWDPNRDGLAWFAAEVWPRVIAAYPDAEGRIAGNGVDDPGGLPDGLTFVGRVEDVAAFAAEATVVAVPVIRGVGASVKFPEALASGASVIATPDGANAIDDPPAFVSDDPEAWAGWIADRLRARADEPAPAAARAWVLSTLDWDAAIEPIDRWLRDGTGGTT